ncbi:MAG TPA: archease, partial [Actinomycetes bacterium]|nr:archease [Actinomycetes bacterium]
HRPGPGRPVTLEVSAADLGGLLVDWLNEVLWLQEVRQAAVAGVRVERVALDEPDGGGAAAADPGGLLVDWLNEVLWLREVRQAAVAGVRVERVALDEPDGGAAGAEGPGPGGDGVARGVVELADGGEPPDGTFVKAVTYHRLRVEREPGGGWVVEVYLDV